MAPRRVNRARGVRARRELLLNLGPPCLRPTQGGSEVPMSCLLFSPLTGERLTEQQVLALGFSRETIQRQRPIPEKVGRELLLPTPGGSAWALLPSTHGPAWFPVERMTA